MDLFQRMYITNQIPLSQTFRITKHLMFAQFLCILESVLNLKIFIKFQEENLKLKLDSILQISSLALYRVRVPVQVQIFLLKFDNVNLQITNYVCFHLMI